jgi:hypothetical protein
MYLNKTEQFAVLLDIFSTKWSNQVLLTNNNYTKIITRERERKEKSFDFFFKCKQSI